MLSGKAGELWNLLDTPLRSLGYELVDLDYLSGGKGGATLRLFIDFLPPEDGSPRNKITVEDCATASNAISLVLDEADLISHQYNLEVSSPGMERRVRKLSDFQRFIGREIQVELLEKVEGRRKLHGTIQSASDDSVAILVSPNLAIPFSLDNLKRAQLVFHFDAYFQKHFPNEPTSSEKGL